MFFAFPMSNAQWVSAKKKPTQFGDNKHAPDGPREWWGGKLIEPAKENPSEPTVKP